MKREKILGGKGERISTKGKDLGEDKEKDLRGGKPGGKDLNKERWEKILGRKRGKIAGWKKGLRGERRERISTGRVGKTS